MEFLLTFIGTVAAIMASFFSWLGYVISKRAEERARPCIGETLWTERSDSYFVTLKIFPGPLLSKIICSLTLASTFTVNPGPRKLKVINKPLLIK